MTSRKEFHPPNHTPYPIPIPRTLYPLSRTPYSIPHTLYPILQVFEGYGQTECAAGATVTTAGDLSAGCVGPPIPCSIIKLADVPDMNYFAAKGEGEVSGI